MSVYIKKNLKCEKCGYQSEQKVYLSVSVLPSDEKSAKEKLKNYCPKCKNEIIVDGLEEF